MKHMQNLFGPLGVALALVAAPCLSSGLVPGSGGTADGTWIIPTLVPGQMFTVSYDDNGDPQLVFRAETTRWIPFGDGDLEMGGVYGEVLGIDREGLVQVALIEGVWTQASDGSGQISLRLLSTEPDRRGVHAEIGMAGGSFKAPTLDSSRNPTSPGELVMAWNASR